MNEKEAERLVTLAKEKYGYGAHCSQILGGTYRVYVTVPGRWTFVTDEEDLEDVSKDQDLWIKG